MFLPISFGAALVGTGIAGVAALRPDTGVDGTPGAFLALLGATVVTLMVGVLWMDGLSGRGRGWLTVGAVGVAILAALAAWFLMQVALAVAMVIACLALLLRGVMSNRRATP